MSEIFSNLELFVLVSVVVANMLLAFFVYKNNPKSVTNIIFIALSFVTSLWMVAMYTSAQPSFFSHALLLTRLTMFLAIPQVILFYLLAETLPSNVFPLKKKYLAFLFIEAFFLMAFTLTSYVFKEVRIVDNAPQQIPGVGIVVFAVVVVSFSIGTLYTLIKKMRNSSGVMKQQLKFVFWGIMLMLSLIVVTILVPTMFFQNGSFASLTPLYVLIFLGMTAYAIIKHKFLDVRFVLVRAISYTILIFVLATLYAGLMLFVAVQFFGFSLDRRFLILAVVLTTIIALSFGTLSTNLKRLTDKVFFKGEYDSEELLSKLTHVMARTIDLDQMTKAILNILVKNVRVSRVALLILQDHKLVETKSVNVEGGDYILDEKMFDTLQEFFHKEMKKGAQTFVFNTMEEGVYKNIFRECGIEIAIAIHVKNDCVAVLLLDKKLSGEVFSQQDIDFLDIFAGEAGIAIQNAKAYERIKEFSRELEEKVQERTHQLKEAQERQLKEARDVSRLKDEFVFIATHELRAPITAIRIFLEMMPTQRGFFPKDIQEKLDSISQASDHLNQLINDLLEIARSESGGMKLTVVQTDIVEIIHQEMKELSPLAEKKRVKVSFIMNKKIPYVMSDPKKVTEVFTNLLSNAIKYNREEGEVIVTVLERAKDIVVEVKDTGFGIPKEQQDKIFQKFFRATSEDTLDILGTGLGLFIVRMLVEKMGGKIKFTSVQGKGTTIAFSLPKGEPV